MARSVLGQEAFYFADIDDVASDQVDIVAGDQDNVAGQKAVVAGGQDDVAWNLQMYGSISLIFRNIKKNSKIFKSIP